MRSIIRYRILFSVRQFRYTNLSLDGGGVRGYSSLLILETLMTMIGEIEQETQGPAEPDSDASETQSSSRINGSRHEDERSTSCLLPCLYFDYMFGTSTGG